MSDQMQNCLNLLVFLCQELMGRPLRLKVSQKNDDLSESNEEEDNVSVSNKEEEDVSKDQPAES